MNDQMQRIFPLQSLCPAVLFYAGGGTAALEYYAGVRTPDWEVDII